VGEAGFAEEEHARRFLITRTCCGEVVLGLPQRCRRGSFSSSRTECLCVHDTEQGAFTGARELVTLAVQRCVGEVKTVFVVT